MLRALCAVKRSASEAWSERTAWARETYFRRRHLTETVRRSRLTLATCPNPRVSPPSSPALVLLLLLRVLMNNSVWHTCISGAAVPRIAQYTALKFFGTALIFSLLCFRSWICFSTLPILQPSARSAASARSCHAPSDARVMSSAMHGGALARDVGSVHEKQEREPLRSPQLSAVLLLSGGARACCAVHATVRRERRVCGAVE